MAPVSDFAEDAQTSYSTRRLDDDDGGDSSDDDDADDVETLLAEQRKHTLF